MTTVACKSNTLKRHRYWRTSFDEAVPILLAQLCRTVPNCTLRWNCDASRRRNYRKQSVHNSWEIHLNGSNRWRRRTMFLLLVANTVKRHVFPRKDERRDKKKNRGRSALLTDGSIADTEDFNRRFGRFAACRGTSKAHLFGVTCLTLVPSLANTMNNGTSSRPVCSPFFFFFLVVDVVVLLLLSCALHAVVECKKCVTGTVCVTATSIKRTHRQQSCRRFTSSESARERERERE